MGTHNHQLSYKVKTLIGELVNAATEYNRTNSAGLGVNHAKTTQYVSAALAVGVGCRSIPVQAFALECGDDAAVMLQAEGVKMLLSQIGECTYINSPSVLKWSNAIYAARFDQVAAPLYNMSALNTKDYINSLVPDSYQFVSIWAERIQKVTNEFVKEYYEG